MLLGACSHLSCDRIKSAAICMNRSIRNDPYETLFVKLIIYYFTYFFFFGDRIMII